KEELQEAADELKKAEEALKEGKDEEAAEHLQKAGEKMDKVEGGEERKQMVEQIKRVRQIKKTMGQGLGKQGQNQQPGPNPAGNPGQGAGRRPEAPDAETGSGDQKADSEFEKKKKLNVVGYAPNPNKPHPKKTSNEVAGEIKQASQDAPEAIERMRIPKAASDLTKGYFEKLGGQAEP